MSSWLVRLAASRRVADLGSSFPSFAASGGIANLSGLILGGVILLESWHWIYWIIALISLPLAALSIFLIPSPKSLKPTTHTDDQPRLPKMDYLGTFLQTASIVLFVFGLTNSNTVGWSVLLSHFLLFGPAFSPSSVSSTTVSPLRSFDPSRFIC